MVIREARDDSAEGTIKQLRAAVESFSKGTEHKDDLKAVVLKRNAYPIERWTSAEII
jgi:hypothetical protein